MFSNKPFQKICMLLDENLLISAKLLQINIANLHILMLYQAAFFHRDRNPNPFLLLNLCTLTHVSPQLPWFVYSCLNSMNISEPLEKCCIDIK